MNNEHTPEPWKVEIPTNPETQEASLDAGISAIVGGERKIIAEAFGQIKRNGFAPAVANAERLVACVNACAGMNPQAIPGLLAACQEVCARHETCCGNPRDNLDYFYKTLKREIAKATVAP